MLILTISIIPEIGTAPQAPSNEGRGNACLRTARRASVKPRNT